MASTSTRMLRLLSLLQTHRYWAGAELAGRLEVSARTLRRDVDRLRELGYPVQASRGVAGGYQLQPGAALPPLLLDDDEAVAIAVGLRTAAAGSVAGIQDASVRALSKVVAVMPTRLRRRIETLQAVTVPGAQARGPAIDAATITVLAQACRDDERIRFSYAAPESPAADRSVEPHRLVSLGRRWYLVGYDLDRGDWRSFRVDRISAAVATGAKFRPRALPAEDAAAFVERGIRSKPATYTVRVVVAAPAAAVEPHVGQWGTVEHEGPGACRIELHTDWLDWPIALLTAIDAPFTVLSPPELRDRIRRCASLFGAAAESSGVRDGRG